MNTHTIMSWNIRGVSNVGSNMNVKSIGVESEIKLIFLQETKTQQWLTKEVRNFDLDVM